MIKKLINKILIILRIKTKANSRLPSNVKICKNVSISENVIMYRTAPITIGEHTMIACNVIIHTSTHDYNNHPMWLTRIDRPIYIGKHVWIGAGAIILPGVKIEDYAVVGAGSIVTANVPKGAIVAGNPARIIKFRNIDKIKNIQNIPDYPIGSSITKKSFLDKICKPI
ncbi:MAG: DapH/DapD/GlmU-related protein [Patescibacteria group bacterium]